MAQVRPELQDIVDEASAALGADTTLEDTDFNLVAYGDQRFAVDEVRQSSILRRSSTRPVRDWFEQFGIGHTTTPLRTPADPAQGLRTRLCFPARWHGVTYGYLWVLDDDTPLDDPAVTRVQALAEHAAGYLAQLTRQIRDDAFTVADLLSTDLDKVAQAALRVTDRGLVGRHQPVAAVWVAAVGAEVPAALSPNLWSLPRTVLVDRGPDSSTLVVPLRQLEDDSPALQVAAQALRLYADELPRCWSGRLVAGVGETRAGVAELRGSWLEARLASRVAASVATVGAVARWADLGLYRLLAGVPASELCPLVLDPPVRALLDSPDAELRHTVAVYLDLAANVHDTAAALHIHRQTLYYRLGKVEALTGLRFASGHDRLRLHLALMLLPLLDDDPGTPAGEPLTRGAVRNLGPGSALT